MAKANPHNVTSSTYDFREHQAPREKKLKEVVLERAKNGGHTVTHRFTHFEHEPEVFVFGPDDGGKLLAHLGKHAGVRNAQEEAGEKQHEG